MAIKRVGLTSLPGLRHLPDLNLRTAGGTSCSATLQSRLESVLESQDRHDFMVNGRFKGDYITYQYGDPTQNI